MGVYVHENGVVLTQFGTGAMKKPCPSRCNGLAPVVRSLVCCAVSVYHCHIVTLFFDRDFSAGLTSVHFAVLAVVQ